MIATCPLDEVCEITMGQAPAGSSYNDQGIGYPLVAGAGDFGDLYPTVKKYTNQPSKISKPGDIILGIRASIGEKVLSNKEYCLGRGVAGLRPTKLIDARFLWHWLSHIAPVLRSKGRGATFLQVNRADIKSLEIPVPALSDQRRLAKILDTADGLRAKRRESLAQLDALLQSIFIDFFGDPVSNPKGWKSYELGDLFEIARGGSPRPIQNYLTDYEDGINWIMIGDALEGSRYIVSTKKKIRPEGLKKSRMVYPGDFLLTNSMSFGRPYIMKTSGCIHDGWLVLSPKSENVLPEYFYNLLCTDALYSEFSRRASGAVVKNLKTSTVKSVSVALPPVKIQKEFQNAVSLVEVQRERLTQHLNLLNSLFSSLQQIAFSGAL